MNSSTKTMAAVFLSVGAAFIIVNRVVTAAPWEDWLPAAALLLLAAAFAVWAWRDAHPAPARALAAAPDAPAAVYPPPVEAAAEPEQPDDLTVIEGIGPKMSAALVAAGIATFARLAQASQTELEAAITAAGMRFAPSMATWAEQAAFAARGDWDGLKAYQETLTAGRKA